MKRGLIVAAVVLGGVGGVVAWYTGPYATNRHYCREDDDCVIQDTCCCGYTVVNQHHLRECEVHCALPCVDVHVPRPACRDNRCVDANPPADAGAR